MLFKTGNKRRILIKIKSEEEYEKISKIEDENNYIKECLIKGLHPTLISEEMIDKLSESIARIEFEKKISTGFFMKLNLHEKQYCLLLTCAHTITQENIDSKITIRIYYGKKKKEDEREIELDSKNRLSKSYKEFDATLLEILPEDNIPEYKYLYPVLII